MSRNPVYVVALVACATLQACAGAPPSGPATAADLHDARSYFPLTEGNVWSYNIDTGEELPTLGITRVLRAAGGRVDVSVNGQAPQVYEVRAEGIAHAGSDTWLLRSPIEAGASWPATHGKTAHVAATGESVTTPAGTFSDCIRVEEAGGPDTTTVTTRYCPSLGPVEVRSQMSLQHSDRTASVSALLIGFEVAELQPK